MTGAAGMTVTPSCHAPGVEGVPATRFAAMVRFLAAESREAGLVVPAFRSPPRIAGAARSIRRTADHTVVSIQLRDREPAAVADDIIEGIVVANALGADRADAVRRQLRAAVAPAEIDLTADDRPGRNLGARARVAERQTQAA